MHGACMHARSCVHVRVCVCVRETSHLCASHVSQFLLPLKRNEKTLRLLKLQPKSDRKQAAETKVPTSVAVSKHGAA